MNLREKDVYKALILADDFTSCLTPLEKAFPSCLVPLANYPFLDYLLDTLERSKVNEIYLYCSNHVDALRNYAKNSKVMGQKQKYIFSFKFIYFQNLFPGAC